MRIEQTMLVITAICTALLSGVLFGYATSVVLGLRRLGDREYLRAMQAVHRTMHNPLLLITFISPVIFLPFEAYLVRGESTPLLLLIIASLLYIGGVVGVTFLRSVPLGNALANFRVAAHHDDGVARVRSQFEKPWNHFHLLRTVAAVGATVLTLIACALV